MKSLFLSHAIGPVGFLAWYVSRIPGEIQDAMSNVNFRQKNEKKININESQILHEASYTLKKNIDGCLPETQI